MNVMGIILCAFNTCNALIQNSNGIKRVREWFKYNDKYQIDIDLKFIIINEP